MLAPRYEGSGWFISMTVLSLFACMLALGTVIGLDVFEPHLLGLFDTGLGSGVARFFHLMP